ncbi:MAG: CRISPR-associated endonuclease Cas2 [Thermoprotei archaeon]|nr:MAG: CRISPR-associated endonuclease Cas2 [Thermoprotei archaeon]
MFVLVAYDISDNRTRDLVARRLLAMGFSRIQRSVFVARGGGGLARDVERLVRRFIDPSSDVVHILLIQDREWSSRIVVGGSGVDEGKPIHVF